MSKRKLTPEVAGLIHRSFCRVGLIQNNTMTSESKPTLQEWLSELATLAPTYGYSASDCTEEIWGDYYRDGYTPLAAIKSDASEA